ncbi:MAG: rhodanese-like domain-containing protein [Rubricoccaceae bacterium]
MAGFLPLLLWACTREVGWKATERLVARDFPGVPQVTADTLAARLAGPRPPVLLDVRAADEFAVSHLPGARRLEPLAGDAGGIPSDVLALPRDTPIVAYCSVGYRSAALATRLKAAGFSDVANLRRGLFGWANEGRPVVRGDAPVQAVHPYDAAWGRLLRPELRASAR